MKSPPNTRRNNKSPRESRKSHCPLRANQITDRIVDPLVLASPHDSACSEQPPSALEDRVCLSGSVCVERALTLRAHDSQYVHRQRCCVNGLQTPTFTVDPRVGERLVNDPLAKDHGPGCQGSQ